MIFFTKKIINREINKKQKELNVLYEEKGLTDEILEKQVLINTVRNFFNIPDSNEKIYKEYVQ